MAKKKYIITEKSELDSKQYIAKRADIVAEVTGTDIDIKVDSTCDDSYCYLSDMDKECTCVVPEGTEQEGDEDINCPVHSVTLVPKYNIVLGRTGGVPTKTLAYHELSHILHESMSTVIWNPEVYGRRSVTNHRAFGSQRNPRVIKIHSESQREIIELVLGQQVIIDMCTKIYDTTYNICMDSKFFRFDTTTGNLQWIGHTVQACNKVEGINNNVKELVSNGYNHISDNRLTSIVDDILHNRLVIPQREKRRDSIARMLATRNTRTFVEDVMLGTAGITTEVMLQTFNVLEDQRIESLTSCIWLGTSKMFIKAREVLGKLLIDDNKKANQVRKSLDPVTALLSVRFGVLDEMKSLVRSNSGRVGLTDEQLDTIKESLSMCELVGKDIPLRVMQTKLKPILFEFIVEQMLSNAEKRVDDNILEGESLVEQLDNELLSSNVNTEGDSPDGLDRTKQHEFDDKRYRIGNLNPNETGSGNNNSRDFRGQFNSTPKGEYQSRHDVDYDWRKYVRVDDNSIDMNEANKKLGIEDFELVNDKEEISKEELTNSTAKAKEHVNTLKEILTGDGDSKDPTHIKRFDRESTGFNTDSAVTTAMNNILRELREKYKPKLSDTGDEVDIDAYIDMKQAGHGDPFIEPAVVNGLDIFVTIDGSGSMSGTEIDTARDMVANFFKVAEQNNNIDVKANVWSGNSDGDVCITPIESLNDCSMITTQVVVPKSSTMTYYNRNFYSTPTHEGVKYSVERFKTMGSKNKLFVLITDGFPAHTKKGYEIPFEILVKKVNQELTKARMMPNVSVLTIMLGDNSPSWENYLWKMYKDTWIGLKDMSKAKQFIEKEVRRKINEVFRA